MKIAARAAPEPDRATEILARGFRKGPCDIEAELIATSPYERSVGQAIGFLWPAKENANDVSGLIRLAILKFTHIYSWKPIPFYWASPGMSSSSSPLPAMKRRTDWRRSSAET